MPISEVRLRLGPWTERALDVLSEKTGMDYTNLVKQALTEYIQRRFTRHDYERIEYGKDGALKDAFDEWVHWNMFLREIPKDQAVLWKKLCIKSLSLMREKGYLPSIEDLYKLGEWVKLNKKYESWLLDFLYYQENILKHHVDLPIPTEDKHKKLLTEGKEDEYYTNKWDEYAENLMEKMGPIIDPLFSVLYDIKKEKRLATDRETALYLLNELIKAKGIKKRDYRPFRGLAGFCIDPGDTAKLIEGGKLNEKLPITFAIEQ